MLYKSGLVIGKFMPFHKGHELMINFGLNVVEELHLIVSGTWETPSPAIRSDWIAQTFPEVEVIDLHEEVAEPTYDAEGVAIEDWYWDYWLS